MTAWLVSVGFMLLLAEKEEKAEHFTASFMFSLKNKLVSGRF